MQDWQNPGAKGLLNITAQYSFVDLFPADQLALIQDLLDGASGLDTFASSIFVAAKKRLLNSTLLQNLSLLPEFEWLSTEVKANYKNFNALAVSLMHLSNIDVF